MFDISLLEPLALKVWAIKKYEDWEKSVAYQWGKEALELIEEPTEGAPDSTQRWPSAIEERLNYLMARQPVLRHKDIVAEAPQLETPIVKPKKPIVEPGQEELDALNPAIREYTERFLCCGHALWIVQGDGEGVIPQPMLMEDTLVIYKDKKKKHPICYVRKITEVEVDTQTGAETTYTQYEVWVGKKKYLFDNARPELDTVEELAEEPHWVEIGTEGEKSCFATVRSILIALNKVFKNQDTTVEANTKPLTEIRGYSGTDVEEARDAVEKASVVLTEGDGGVNVHTRQMDSASIELWTSRLLQQFYQGTGTVGKDKELEFAVSGKALDRLFVQAEQKAKQLGDILEPAIKEVLRLQGVEGDIDIVWNTDRPVDDAETITAIQGSIGLLSKKTLLEQHPWVDDVDEELRRLSQEASDVPDLFADEPPVKKLVPTTTPDEI